MIGIVFEFDVDGESHNQACDIGEVPRVGDVIDFDSCLENGIGVFANMTRKAFVVTEVRWVIDVITENGELSLASCGPLVRIVRAENRDPKPRNTQDEANT